MGRATLELVGSKLGPPCLPSAFGKWDSALCLCRVVVAHASTLGGSVALLGGRKSVMWPPPLACAGTKATVPLRALGSLQV